MERTKNQQKNKRIRKQLRSKKNLTRSESKCFEKRREANSPCREQERKKKGAPQTGGPLSLGFKRERKEVRNNREAAYVI